MSALKKLLIVVAILAALIAAIPLLFPYDRYKPDIERAMTARLDTDIKIAAIHFSYNPKPQLVLDKLTIGRNGEGEVSQILIPIDFKNLINIRHELANISLDKARFTQAFALSLPGRLKPNPGGRDIYFATLKLNELTIQLDKDVMGPLSGLVKFNPDGTFKLVTLSDKDGRANLTIKPADDKFALDFEANNWVLPGDYPDARFDQLILRGIADKEGILIDDINGLIFGAATVGQAKLSWTDGWKLTGSLQTKSMQAEPLISLVSPITRTTGRMAATVNFEFIGQSYADLFKQRHMDMKFTISDGNLHNLDLVTPLKSQNPSILQRGGQTRFDTLSGDFLLDKEVVSLRNLMLNSGKFTATGNLAINAEQKLNGRISAKLASGAIVVNVPMTVAGKLEAPELHSAGASKPGTGDDTTRIF